MKKFFVAAAASLLIFGSQAEAAPIDDLNASNIQTQEVGHWADFRDEVLGRETDRERRERKKWERRERERYEREREERERREWERRQRHRQLPPPPVYVPPAPRPGYGAPPAPRPGYGVPTAPVRPGMPPPPRRR